MTSNAWPTNTPAVQVRVARPTDRLEEVIRFYEQGVGLRRLGDFAGHAGYTGVMLGLPDRDCHLEFTTHEAGSPCPAPTEDNLLVLYFANQSDQAAVAERLRTLGHAAVPPENPFWSDNGGVTIEDPDGWRLVLMPGPAF